LSRQFFSYGESLYKKNDPPEGGSSCLWAHLDLNQGPTDYEPDLCFISVIISIDIKKRKGKVIDFNLSVFTVVLTTLSG